MADEKVDLLAFGAHPDDVEITSGGTLFKLKKMGYRTGIVDMTRGEMGTYGTIEEREKEAQDAAEVLKLDVRVNLGMPDGGLENTAEHRRQVIEVIRTYRPEVVLAPVTRTRHPDHGNAGTIVREAAFLAGLEKIDTGQEKFRPSAVLHYPELFRGTPDLAVDVSDEWEVKLDSIKAHQSQVYDEKIESDMVKTLIKSKDFWEVIDAKFRYYGGVVGVKYAEVFYFDGIPRVDDLIKGFVRNIK
jgi:bacillithiol biosynthesis deacetylase BshB1